jgi:hypothetical protein
LVGWGATNHQDGKNDHSATSPQPKAGENQVKPASEKELEDIKNLCSCLSINQLDDYSTWIRIGHDIEKARSTFKLLGGG